MGSPLRGTLTGAKNMMRSGRGWLVGFCFALTGWAAASGFGPGDPFGPEIATGPKRMLLIPLDDRPATTQFAQMIGQIADVQVDMPPRELLGRFKIPGKPDEILAWLDRQDLRAYDAVIVNAEMIAYGGLIASRTNAVTRDQAMARLRRLVKIRRESPRTKFYGFTSLMRLAPTSLKSSAKWRDALTQYVILKSRTGKNPTAAERKRLADLLKKIPPESLASYQSARVRNNRVQQDLIRMVHNRSLDYLILGQDDAQKYGPHLAETATLQRLADQLRVRDRLYFCEGIDQHANVLLSRAMLASSGWAPRVRIYYADAQGKTKIAPYETETVESSVMDQLIASGAQPAQAEDDFDYSLYINTPNPRPDAFQAFADSLRKEVDQGLPVAVGDINLGYSGTGDPRLFEALSENGRSMRLLSYAGWNTAGNTIGTAIPAANVYLYSRKRARDPLARELNQRSFLLHRLVNDFEFHRFTRPRAYEIQSQLGETKEETYGQAFNEINAFVQVDVRRRLESVYQQQFHGKRFFAGNELYEVKDITQIQVELPWPRAYEVRIGFKLEAERVAY